MNDRCDARHYPHDCRKPGACRRALLEMMANMDARSGRTDERAGSRAA